MSDIKKKRQKEKERVLFDKKKKEKVLHKSKGVCSHCGKPLSLETMTVDHVIPLSKGGTNETSNLAALCKECNKYKANYVIKPSEYYKYLDYIYLDNMKKDFERYCSEFEWLSKRNLFSSDRLYGESMSALRSSSTVVVRGSRCEFTKAVYSDLDDIYYAYMKYFKRYKVDITKELKESLKNFIKMVFEEGELFFSKNNSGDINIVVPVYLCNFHAPDESNELERDSYYLIIGKVLVMYEKPSYMVALSSFVHSILYGIHWSDSEVFPIPYEISFFTFTDIGEEFLSVFYRGKGDMISAYLGAYGIYAKGMTFSTPMNDKEADTIINHISSLEVEDKSSKFMEYCSGFVSLCKSLRVVEYSKEEFIKSHKSLIWGK